MKKISCLLIDDEPPALEILRTYIDNTPSLEIAGECPHAIAAFDFLQHHPVDLIFLDVNMPKLTGTEFLKALKHPPRVIFTTAHRDFAVEGFELGAVDYLLKPFSLERFWRAIQRVTSHEGPAPDKNKTADDSGRFLYVRAERKMVRIMVNEILYVESLKDYVRYFLTSRQIITKQTITAAEALMPDDEFIRIHRSFIVAADKIDSYTQTSVFVGKHELPVGPLYRHTFLQKIKNF
jgi:DNA-binding LytR/AlgR family response regulator